MEDYPEGKTYILKVLPPVCRAQMQYSCTTVQYGFHPAFLPVLKPLAERLQLRVEQHKNRPGSITARCVVAELTPPEFDAKCYVSHQSGNSEYTRSPDQACEMVDYYRLLCLAKDLDAEVSMCFSGIPAHVGYEYRPQGLPNHPNTYWLFAHVTDACNLDCTYCYRSERTHHMKLGELKRAMREVKRGVLAQYRKEPNWHKRIWGMPKFGVTLGGGEPTGHPQFAEMVASAKSMFDFVTVSTNGTNVRVIRENSDAIDGVAVSCPFLYDGRLARIHPVPISRMNHILRSLRRIPRRVLSVIITSRMRVAHVAKVLDRARSFGATGVLFVLYKPFGFGQARSDLLPDLYLTRDIVAEIARHAVQKSSSDFEVLVDACSLAYTTSFHCSSYHCRYVEPKRETRIIYIGRAQPVCPWAAFREDPDPRSCPFEHIYRAKLIQSAAASSV